MSLAIWPKVGGGGKQEARSRHRLVLRGQHDSNDPGRDVGVRWVRRPAFQQEVVVVDLPQDSLACGCERTEIVFVVGVVGSRELVELPDTVEDRADGHQA